MEVTQLHYFKTAAHCSSFTLAAEQLGITQSALSRSIAGLEKELGFQLFERNGNRVNLNQNGKIFLSRIITVLNTLKSAVEETKAMVSKEEGTVRIAVSETVFLKNIIYHFIQKHPNVHIDCLLQSDDAIHTALLEGAIDFSVTRNPIIDPSFHGEVIFVDQMQAILPPDHPLNARSSLHLSELANEHFIISNVNYDISSEIETMCSQAGFSPYIVYRGSGEDLAGLLVRKGFGVMLAPYSISRGVVDLHLEQGDDVHRGIPIVDSFCRMNIGITSRFGQFHSEAALELYDDIVQYFKQL